MVITSAEEMVGAMCQCLGLDICRRKFSQIAEEMQNVRTSYTVRSIIRLEETPFLWSAIKSVYYQPYPGDKKLNQH